MTRHSSILATFVLVGLLGLGGGCRSRTSGHPQTMLNSERIEQRFGSYGVEILAQTDARRVTSLYSNEAVGRVCRTLAIVTFNSPMQAELTPFHQAILEGQSIGAHFKANGWTVKKKHRDVGSVEFPPGAPWISSKMKISLPRQLAVHRYDLFVEKAAARHRYATITEMHHPAYLSTRNLEQIYGMSSSPSLEHMGTRLLSVE